MNKYIILFENKVMNPRVKTLKQYEISVGLDNIQITASNLSTDVSIGTALGTSSTIEEIG